MIGERVCGTSDRTTSAGVETVAPMIMEITCMECRAEQGVFEEEEGREGMPSLP